MFNGALVISVFLVTFIMLHYTIILCFPHQISNNIIGFTCLMNTINNIRYSLRCTHTKTRITYAHTYIRISKHIQLIFETIDEIHIHIYICMYIPRDMYVCMLYVYSTCITGTITIYVHTHNIT